MPCEISSVSLVDTDIIPGFFSCTPFTVVHRAENLAETPIIHERRFDDASVEYEKSFGERTSAIRTGVNNGFSPITAVECEYDPFGERWRRHAGFDRHTRRAATPKSIL